jgi:hypothetical protein
MIRLTSLLLVEERLQEANYFAKRIGKHRFSHEVAYELNAFLSAARSVTFLLQKEMSRVVGFTSWWDLQRSQLTSDASAVFFHRLRNFSQKEGRVSLVSTTGPAGPRGRWTHRFAGNEDPVPQALLHRDVVECCREHVAKLAQMVLACAAQFPFHSRPSRVLTGPGVEALGISLEDIEETLGFPRGWTALEGADVEMRCRLLRRHVDGVDFPAIRRLANWRPKQMSTSVTASTRLSSDLARTLVEQLESRKRVSTLDVATSLFLGTPHSSESAE